MLTPFCIFFAVSDFSADKITVLNAADFQLFLEMRVTKIFLVEEVRRCAIEEIGPGNPTKQLESKTRKSATHPQGVKQIEKNTKKTDVLANLTANFLTYLNDQSKLHSNPSDCLDAATETAAKDPEPTPAKKTDASPPAASTEKTDKPPAQTVVPDNEDNKDNESTIYNESITYINYSFDTVETAGSLYSSLESIADESEIYSLQPVADAINCGKGPVVLPVLPLPTVTSNDKTDCFEKQQDQLKIDGWTIVDSTDLTEKTVGFEIPTITITTPTPIKLPRSSPIDIPINSPADNCVSHFDSISSVPNRESTIVGDKSHSSIEDLNCAISLFNREQNACVASHQPTHPGNCV